MVKVGIIGLGFMGLTHLRAYEKHPRAKLVAVSDTVKERLEGDLSGVAGNLGDDGERFDFSEVNTYENLDDLLADPEVELVSICLPTRAHAAVTAKALAQGKHVLCEKPMGLTEGDLDAMLAAAKDRDTQLMVAQCIRFWPDYRKAAEIVRSGDLGKVKAARFTRESAMPGWGEFRDESKSGGMILDLSVHDIDFAHHLVGVPDRVRADGTRDLEKGIDQFVGTMYVGDVPIFIEAGWYFVGEYPFSMGFDIFCEEGVLSFASALERPLTVFHADGRTETPELREGDGYFGEVDYLISCIEEGKPVELCPPEETALSVKLAFLLRESQRQGGAEVQTPVEYLQR